MIEASRPRALEQLGIVANELLMSGPSVWISITGYGRAAPGRDWVAFGDDAAAAGGLVVWDDDGPCFCADAIADPLSGLTAAAAALEALEGDDAVLLDVAMARVASALRRAAALVSETLFRNVEVEGVVTDVRVRDGLIVESADGLTNERADDVVDAGGGALIPGLHDHHLHLLATAAAAASIMVGPPAVRDARQFAAALATAAAGAAPGAWLRAGRVPRVGSGRSRSGRAWTRSFRATRSASSTARARVGR